MWTKTIPSCLPSSTARQRLHSLVKPRAQGSSHWRVRFQRGAGCQDSWGSWLLVLEVKFRVRVVLQWKLPSPAWPLFMEWRLCSGFIVTENTGFLSAMLGPWGGGSLTEEGSWEGLRLLPLFGLSISNRNEHVCQSGRILPLPPPPRFRALAQRFCLREK